MTSTTSLRAVFRALPAAFCLAALAACSTPAPKAPALRASAAVAPTQGQTVSGTVSFSETGDHVAVRVQLAGLAPNSEHGFHLHEKGDCSAPDGMSTGGHFNPTGKPHGAPNAEHHAGDMPALTADASGKVSTEFMLHGVTIGSGTTDIVGRGLIVHAKRDDYITQPTGDSGARIGCGVVVRN
ncbi:MAG TPA: superoxide dismutase family protein [Ideonella sp.]|nr:superoxide dismutase family protein [Ideonella sp.]